MNPIKSIIVGACECAAFLTLIALFLFAWVGFQDGDIITAKAVILSLIQ